MKTFFLSAAILLFAFTTADKLTGRWESKSETGNVTGVFFKEDQSFDGYVNKKVFVSGTYSLQDSLFTFTDNGCDGKPGIYKLRFYSKGDSLHFIAVTDSCEQRKHGMESLNLGRVKE